MRKKIEWLWELIEEINEGRLQTYRAKVIGGWVLKSVTQDMRAKVMSESMVFIADRDHEWHIIPPFNATCSGKDAEKGSTVRASDFEA